MTNTNTCTVGCKLPNGLTVQLSEGVSITLKGANSHLPAPQVVVRDGRTTHTAPPAMPRSVAPGITTGVDRRAFEAWLRSHADLGFVKSGAVFIIEGSIEQAIAANRGDHFHGVNPDAPGAVTRLS